ncbi:MAG: TlpA family protein disulfide reductase [Dysgonamonadaceae bacterium]|jgi:thiol-disulfide isomerase/thioredoxin|nr:TlpA family protein disulfide reductase [Dysgonamonadaceae bacterium]
MNKLSIFLISFVFSIIIIPLRGGDIDIGGISGWSLSGMVGFLLLFSFTFFALYKNKKKDEKLSDLCILFLLLIGAILLELPFRIVQFESSLASLLETFVRLFGILSGYLFYRTYRYFPKHKIISIAIGAICFSIAMWSSTKGYEYWLNKRNFDTFIGRLAHAEFIPLRFQTTTGDTVKVEDFNGKYLLLDCWYTYCGVCYDEFPKVQKLYERYKNNENIVIYSLHSRMEETMEVGSSTWGGESYSTGTEILKREGYSFPTLSICMNDPVLREEVGVWVFPTVLIFDKKSKLIFRGSIDLAERYLRRIMRE